MVWKKLGHSTFQCIALPNRALDDPMMDASLRYRGVGIGGGDGECLCASRSARSGVHPRPWPRGSGRRTVQCRHRTGKPHVSWSSWPYSSNRRSGETTSTRPGAPSKCMCLVGDGQQHAERVDAAAIHSDRVQQTLEQATRQIIVHAAGRAERVCRLRPGVERRHRTCRTGGMQWISVTVRWLAPRGDGRWRWTRAVWFSSTGPVGRRLASLGEGEVHNQTKLGSGCSERCVCELIEVSVELAPCAREFAAVGEICWEHWV
jgi:hypothetical protein